jgi:hypothetical protein
LIERGKSGIAWRLEWSRLDPQLWVRVHWKLEKATGRQVFTHTCSPKKRFLRIKPFSLSSMLEKSTMSLPIYLTAVTRLPLVLKCWARKTRHTASFHALSICHALPGLATRDVYRAVNATFPSMYRSKVLSSLLWRYSCFMLKYKLVFIFLFELWSALNRPYI